MSDFNNDIAIIGMACRYPGAPDIDAFWQNLINGVESITRFSDEELLAAGVDPAEIADPNYVPAYGWLEGIDQFDAPFFGLTPREAQLLDPQQRLFLMCAWTALEDAGVDPEQENRPIGVFTGEGQPIYFQENILPNHDLVAEMGAFQMTLSNDKDFLASRIAYKLNLKGPAITVQTACSTSLVAIHLAIQSLLSGECDLALAGGSSVVTTGKRGYLHTNEGLFGPDGHCRTFDAKAGGMVGGDGVGAVILKRLEDAQAEGDHIYAVIKGSAVNNDGAARIGYTAPGVEGQAAVILEAQAVANVHPDTITMIEAHGTGTPLGDPIEVAALTAAFRTQTTATNYCALGAVKTNIGHTNTAAGVAGIIKTALALYHKTIPPSLNFQTPNPEIDFENSPFYVNTTTQPWPEGHTPRRAGVSSFGMGGTNAHAILEEAPLGASSGPSRLYHLLALSGKTGAALEKRTSDLAEYLQSNPDVNLADVAYTLQNGRQRFQFRRTAVVQSVEEAVERLQNPAGTGVWTTNAEMVDPPLAFVFPGGGSQYVNMGRDLYDTEPVFRDNVDYCARLLQNELERDLRDYLYPPLDKEAEATEALNRPSISMPATFVINYASAQLWLSWGIRPQALIGHSLGEYAAACLAGVFSVEDAIKLVTKRGQLTEQIQAGGLMGVSLSEPAVLAYLKRMPEADTLSIAAVNAPEQTVIAGTNEDLSKLEALFEAREVHFRRLMVRFPAHSVMVEPVLDEFRSFVSNFDMKSPTLPLISSVTGGSVTAEEATDPEYWVRHLRQPVRFAEVVETLLSDSQRVILEVGPGQVLTTLIQQNPLSAGRTLLNSLRHPKQIKSDAVHLLTTLGQLWQAGVLVDWPAYYKGEQRRRLSLPTYPFDEKRYWLDPIPQQPAASHAKSLKKNPDPEEWLYTPSWQRTGPLQGSAVTWPEGATWLIFEDEHGLGLQLVKRLRSADQRVLTVAPGQQFSAGDDDFVIDPERPQDYQTLIKTLRDKNSPPTHILHLWQYGPTGDFAQANLEQELNLGFFSLFHLTKALDANNVTQTIHLTVFTSGMQEVTGLEPLAPERAAVLGPCKVIPFEYGHIRTLSIDAEFPDYAGTADQLLADTLSPPDDHTKTVVAYRGPFQWRQSFTKTAPKPDKERPPRLQQQGVYLITGGLGGVGLALAEYLARTVQGRLVLVGRSGLPPRSTWDNVTKQATREQIDAVLALEAMGAEVLIAAADVTNLEQMTAVFAKIKARFGPIQGIIHSAGIAGDGAIARKTGSQAMSVLAAKVQGTQILHRLAGDKLDFFVLCSSAASILGGYGQVDYTAANAVLDAFAPYRARQGDFSASIYWDAWQSVGLAVKTTADLPPDLLKQRLDSLRLGLTNEEGQQIFHHVLNGRASQVIVSTYDFYDRYQNLLNVAGVEAPQDDGGLTLETMQPAKLAGAAVRPELDTGYLPPRNKVEETIAARWQLLFGIDRIGVHDDFFELGGHSLLATQLLNRLHKDFPNAALSLNALFSNPTIAGVAALIQDQAGTQDTAESQTAAPTGQSISAYLREQLTQSLGVEKIEADTDLLALGLEASTADLIWRLRRDHDLRLYPQELLDHPTLARMAEFVSNALDQQADWMTAAEKKPATNGNGRQAVNLRPPTKMKFIQPATKNPPLIFLLSAPRSGSTLLRLMLAGHSDLFCPPELALLAYNSLDEWQAHQQSFFAQTGVQQALSTLLGWDEAAIQAKLDELAQAEHPIQAAYRFLQETAAPRTLVDKTPGYAQHPAVLGRAETLFDQPKYIHLVRHPYPVIDSFVRHRLHVVLGQPESNPALVAEAVWIQSQQNLIEFGQRVGDGRYHQILYEELVQNPRKIMYQLCEFLTIDYDERLLHPYKGKRMIAGPGDPDILQHEGINSELGDIWQKIRLPWPLNPETQALAAVFGYELPNEQQTVGDAPQIEAPPPENLEELTDAEVDALLRQLMEE